MNCKEFEQSKCRICLNQNIIVDWNEALHGYSNFSYKDCYYKYTQMECVESYFSSMLCQTCSNGLEYIHNFILKAIDTHKQLQETYHLSSKDIDIICNMELDTESDNKNKEEEIELKPYILSPEELYIESSETKVHKILPITYGIQCTSELKSEKESEKEIYISELILSPEKLSFMPKDTNRDKKVKRRQHKQNSVKSVINVEDEVNNSDNLFKTAKSSRLKSRRKTKVQKISLSLKERLEATRPLSIGEQPICCSICSKVLGSKYNAIKHEQTHIENRERKETCTICGLKLLNKACLYTHMRTHSDNRKKHECEFCNKSFYNMGALNVHKRMHLGQMIPCSLCSKKFFRQIDLDKHMNSHSATRITAEAIERKKIYVQCKECDKTMLSTNFKAHRAMHLNEPLVKCSICSKEYYIRGSLIKHLKRQHQILKGASEYVTVIKESRMSHLLLEQTTDIQKSDK